MVNARKLCGEQEFVKFQRVHMNFSHGCCAPVTKLFKIKEKNVCNTLIIIDLL